MGVLIRISLNLQIVWGIMVILTILILPIQELSISFHLFVPSSVSFISVLQFSKYRFSTSLGRLIPRYFILFDVMVDGIVSLTFLSDSLSLMCRNEADFHILILYLATLLNSLMSSTTFQVVYLGFSMYSIMSSANSDSFTSSYMIWFPLISFSCQIAVARTANTMLNKSGHSKHPCFVTDLRRNAFRFSL